MGGGPNSVAAAFDFAERDRRIALVGVVGADFEVICFVVPCDLQAFLAVSAAMGDRVDSEKRFGVGEARIGPFYTDNGRFADDDRLKLGIYLPIRMARREDFQAFFHVAVCDKGIKGKFGRLAFELLRRLI